MRRLLVLPVLLIGLFSCLFLPGTAIAASPGESHAQQPAHTVRVPLVFEQNVGQFERDVRFGTREESVALIPGRDGVVMRLRADTSPAWTPSCDVSLTWDGTTGPPSLAGERPVRHGVTAIVGRNPADWRQGIPAFQRVRWARAYPGIDIVFYGIGRDLEYDLVVAPGADPSRIVLSFSGARDIQINEAGDVEIDTAGGRLLQRAPRVYQQDGASVREVGSRYRLRDDGRVVVDLAAFDPSLELTVDPVLTWATLLGSGSYEDTRGVAVDAAGNVYVLVSTYSSAYPTRVAIGSDGHDTHLVLTKLSPLGDEVLYVTSVSGNRQVDPMALAVDAQGRAHVTGSTGATDLPLVAPFQSVCRSSLPDTNSCYDGFLLRLDATGTQLEQSTYLGGLGWDAPFALALDPSGCAVVTGVTESADFPLAAAHQPARATCPTCEVWQDDVFVTKFSADGASLVFSTYLGGPNDEYARSVSIDAQGAVYVSGSLYASGFPSTQTVVIGPPTVTGRGFLAKYSTAGALEYATQLDGLENPLVAVEPVGIAHVTGQVLAAPDATARSLIVVRLAGDGSAVVSSARYGGTDAYVTALAIDSLYREYAVGYASSYDLPLHDEIAGVCTYSLWRSTDGGERYAVAGEGLPDRVIALAFDPRDPRVAYAGTVASGVFYSTDAGATWIQRTTGIGDRLVSRLAVDRFISFVYAVAATPDAAGNALYVTPPGALAWTPAGVGPTGSIWSVAPDPHRPAVVHVGTEDGLFTSRDAGLTWVKSATAPDRVYKVVPDSAHPNTMFLVSGKHDEAGVYRTTDGGESWLRVYQTGSRTGASSVTSLVVAPGTGRRVYLATDRGGFARSDDGGTTWVSMQAPYASDRLVATSESTVYASGNDVSRDGGVTWARVGIGLPLSGASVVPQPSTPATLLAMGYTEPRGFVAVLDPLTSAPLFSSYSPGLSTPQRVAVGAPGQIFVAGQASPQAFPRTADFVPPHTIESQRNPFVARIDLDADPDGDGLPTSWELAVGLDPSEADAEEDADSDGVTNAGEYARGTHPRGTFRRYLAEGASNSFFDTTLAIVNADGTEPAHVWLRFLAAGGEIGHHGLTVPPMTRRTVDLRAAAGLNDAEFSTIIESDTAVAVDRMMSWNARAYGAHSETSLPSPAATWYFAEGATHSGFQLFYLIENPNDTTAVVNATYLTGDGRDVREPYEVPPGSRLTVWANWIPGLTGADVAAVFTVNPATPVLVERAMYLDAGGQALGAGHAAAGVTAPSTRWYFAEGATGLYFDLFLLLANPSFADQQVDVTYLLPDGHAIVKRHTVPARQRLTVWVDFEDAALADTAVAMSVASLGEPIVAERAMWWPGPTAATWIEGHCAFGSTDTATRWIVADGIAGGERRADTYVLVANPTGIVTDVRATLLFEDGARAEQVVTLLPHSRHNISVASDLWSSASPAIAVRIAAGARFGVVIESLDAVTPLIVESSVYWDATGSDGRLKPWAAGTSSRATPLP